MTYVDWFNHQRLRGTITAGPGYTTPAAREADYYRQTAPAPEPATQNTSSRGTRGASNEISRVFAESFTGSEQLRRA